MQVFNSRSESETESIAHNIASEIKRGDIIALFGDLGAGKTAFTRGLTQFLEPKARVTSPTFAIVNKYGRVYHFDMYRITSEQDLLSVGFFDYLEAGNIIIIEWFENIQDFFDEQTLEIKINKTGENSREIIFERLI